MISSSKFTVSVLCSLLSICVYGLSLVPCPDCGTQVSRRAAMCPKCGCKGEVIAEVAKSIPEPVVGDILDVDCDGGQTCALPVTLDGRRFAVLPLDSVLGKSMIRLRHGKHPVEWTIPELATDAPIVRLQIADTNLIAWTQGDGVVFDGKSFKPEGNKVAGVVALSFGTNSYAVMGREWQVLQPKQMKTHGRQVLKLLKNEPYDLPQRTHPYFKMLEQQSKENQK